MQSTWCIKQLEQHGRAILALTVGISETQASWRPAPDEWSMRQVLQHLVSEERNDFRKWLAQAVGLPIRPLPLYDDPRGASTLRLTVAGFRRERRLSLAWLRRLRVADWTMRVTVGHGHRSAGDLLGAWVAHDLLHLRQLVALKYGLTQAASTPHRLGYAGKW
jgi:hypothetical protein